MLNIKGNIGAIDSGFSSSPSGSSASPSRSMNATLQAQQALRGVWPSAAAGAGQGSMPSSPPPSTPPLQQSVSPSAPAPFYFNISSSDPQLDLEALAAAAAAAAAAGMPGAVPPSAPPPTTPNTQQLFPGTRHLLQSSSSSGGGGSSPPVAPSTANSTAAGEEQSYSSNVQDLLYTLAVAVIMLAGVAVARFAAARLYCYFVSDKLHSFLAFPRIEMMVTGLVLVALTFYCALALGGPRADWSQSRAPAVVLMACIVLPYTLLLWWLALGRAWIVRRVSDRPT